jgi:gliding motility-associated protein GldC
MSKTSEIRLAVDVDDDGVNAIRWQADDSPEPGEQHAGAMILALWDRDARSAMRIDLWTQHMVVDDMNDFFFQTLMSLADTYRAATNDVGLAGEIKLFAQDFAQKAGRGTSDREGAG